MNTIIERITEAIKDILIGFIHANVAGKTVELPINVDAELLAKVLSNPEMAALLSTLAKSLESK